MTTGPENNPPIKEVTDSDLQAAPLGTPVLKAVAADYDGQIDERSYYYTGHWGVYKGAMKGMLGGLFIGGGLGGMIGTAAAGVAALTLGTIGMPLLPFIGACALAVGAVGMLKGAHEFTQIGGIAGTGVMFDRQQAELEAKFRRNLRVQAAIHGKEGELRQIMPEAYEPVAALQKPHVNPNDGPHMAAATQPTTKLFHWKTALIGLSVGALAGALLISGGIVALPFLAGATGTMGVIATGITTSLLHLGIHSAGAGALSVVFAEAAPIIMGSAAVTGLFGASFGIDRSFMRRIFDITDHWFSPKPHDKKHHLASLNPTVTREESVVSNLAADRVQEETPQKRFADGIVPRSKPASLAEEHAGRPDRMQQIIKGQRELTALNPRVISPN